MGLSVQFSTISELIEKITAKYESTSRPILRYKTSGAYADIRFGEFREAINETARGFHLLGIRRGDMVSIIAENRPEWAIADLALIKLGAVNVPLYPTLTPKQISYILNDAGVKYVVASNQLQFGKILKVIDDLRDVKNILIMSEKGVAETGRVKFLASVRQEGASNADLQPMIEAESLKATPDDLLTVIYTSGTTGNPKGVMLTHGNIVSNIQAAVPCFPISDADTLLSFLPLSHAFERIVYYVALACGATIAYAESVDTVAENLLEAKPTIVTTVPRLFEKMHNRVLKQVHGSSAFRKKMFFRALDIGYRYRAAQHHGGASVVLKAKYDLADRLVFKKIQQRTGGRLQFFISGGAPLPAELGRFFEAVGILIIEGYGMTEASPVISVNRVDDYKFGTIGKAIPGVEVKIGHDGEILARGPNVMQGYLNNPKATAEMIDKGGWLHTGDIGHFDQDGFLTITDRKKHMFVNSGGKNIAPQHVESLFSQSPYIDQLVLIGEKRMYCTALIVPDFEALREYAMDHEIRFASVNDLINNGEIRKLIEEDINAMQKDLASFERVRKFTLLSSPLTIDNGELTPTLKVKRKIVEEKYRGIIEKMYEETR